MNRPKVLVCGWIGSTNLGDELIASTFADLISDEGGEPTLVTIDPARSAAAAPSQVRHRGALDTVGHRELNGLSPQDQTQKKRGERDHEASFWWSKTPWSRKWTICSMTSPLNMMKVWL